MFLAFILRLSKLLCSKGLEIKALEVLYSESLEILDSFFDFIEIIETGYNIKKFVCFLEILLPSDITKSNIINYIIAVL